MKTVENVFEFKEKTQDKITRKCKKCKGTNDRSCVCRERINYLVSAYEACIPRDFWFIKKTDVVYHKSMFKKIISVYVSKLTKALNKGYGLLIVGNNGSGKTFFLSYILCEAIKKGRYVYYTTAPQLDHDLKRGWADKEVAVRLEQMMGSDFVAIDELGKELEKKPKDRFIISQAERFLKQRFDEGLPTLLASNKDGSDLMEMYGETFSSLIKGKYKTIGLQSKDYRVKLGEKMKKEMGYE